MVLNPQVIPMPKALDAIDEVGKWVSEIEKYLSNLPNIEELITVAEVAYGTGFEDAVKSIIMIPGSGEFVYDPGLVERRQFNNVDWTQINQNSNTGKTDLKLSLDQLVSRFPNIKHVALVVSWFANDLRADQTVLLPGTDNYERTIPYSGGGTITSRPAFTRPYYWEVAGYSSDPAIPSTTGYQISAFPALPDEFGNIAYGGTPADESVVRAIQEIKSRGLKVTFYPFILVDVQLVNALPSPYGGASQPAFPWRGRITCNPAPGQPGTVDKTEAARTQLQVFIDKYRTMITHYAELCGAAGGVDTFLLGSELRGLTWVRDDTGVHPFVEFLIDLAGEVKGVLGPATKVTYGADWSEFTPYQVPEGGLDYHLDRLWMSPNIDAIGIDNYWPTSDWRGVVCVDEGLYPNIYDPKYLAENVQGGEGYDFFYANETARINQVRSSISSFPFRFKDIKNWWLNSHFDRPGFVSPGTKTAWVPKSKPFWFTELGCPAVDKGSNQPNVFIDPKSSESFYPYFSSGVRDDLIQRRHIGAFFSWYSFANHNPASDKYVGKMLDTDRMYLYCWDARPFPYFPDLINIWGDGANYALGHWLQGRQTVFNLPTPEPTPTEVVHIMPATPMPKGEPAIDVKTGKLNPGHHHYLAQIEVLAKRLRSVQLIAIAEKNR